MTFLRSESKVPNRILLVALNDRTAHRLQLLLSRARPRSYELRTTSGAQPDLKAFGDDPIDVVLLELPLPKAAALGRMDRMLGLFPQSAFILLGNHQDPAFLGEMAGRGAHAYLPKGRLDAETLKTALLFAAARRHNQHQAPRHERAGEPSPNEARYHTLLEGIQEGYFELDLDGVFTFSNEALCRIIGLPADALMGKNSSHFMDAATAGMLHEIYQKIYVTGQPKRDFQYSRIDRQGRLRHIESSVFLIKDDTGRATGFRGIARDCTRRIQAEEALRQSEERYRTILDSIEEGYFENDLRGNLTHFNDTLCKIVGYSREELMGLGYRAYTDQATADRIYEVYRKVYRTGEPAKNLEYQFKSKDGVVRYIECCTSLMKDAEGRSIGFRGTVRDTTGRRQSEEILRQSEERYRTILESIEDGYYEVDLKGTLVKTNEGLRKQLGYTREEILALNYRDYTREPYARKVFEAFNRCYTTGKPDRGLQYEITRKDGSKAHVETSVSLIRDASGQPVGFRGIVRDITERTRAMEALRQSEERYRTILDNIEDTYYEVDLKGRFTFLNAAVNKIQGFTKEELMRLSFPEWTDGENAQKLFAAFHQVYATGQPINHLQYEGREKGGGIRHLESSVSLIKDAKGNAVGFRGITRDITERKQAELELQRTKEAAERATRLKSEFLANMSHEIRTPMNGVIGMYNLLLNTNLDAEQSDFVETGKRSAESLLTIINDILDFSKIEAGKLDLEVLDFDLREAMEEMVELPAMQAHQKGLEFIYQIQPEIPSLLRGDPGRLRQIITNLCGNAVKFTKAGEVIIRITAVEETETRIKLRFAVQDTGLGIGASDQDRLFKSFQQVDASTTRKYGGTGLGLAISKRLAELMQGEIGVESEIGKGAIFWFTAVFEKQSHVTEKVLLLPEAVRNKRILVVDDNKTNLEILKGYLGAWGCMCDCARDGEVALSLMHAVSKVSAPFDLVISDMRMPEMDGAELGRRIKNDPVLKETQLIMLTSQGLRGDAAEMKAIGFSAYLTKPIRRSQLFDCLSMVLQKRRQEPRKKKPDLITRHSIDAAKLKKVRILLAEDNTINRKLALHLLEKFGFQADAVANGQEAVQALTMAPYDLVLMDVQMPEMDGIEATQTIRDPDSPVRNHQIPIIAMTAHAMLGDRENCLKAGMDDYVSKPIQPEQLFAAIYRQIAPKKKSENDLARLS
jgi:PAS domain S-box-containing protein